MALILSKRGPAHDSAKQNWHEREELTPEDENVGSRLEPSLSTSGKVILPNKTSMSAKELTPEDENVCALLHSCQGQGHIK